MKRSTFQANCITVFLLVLDNPTPPRIRSWIKKAQRPVGDFPGSIALTLVAGDRNGIQPVIKPAPFSPKVSLSE